MKKVRIAVTITLLVLSLLLTSMQIIGNAGATYYLNANWGHMAPGSGDPELSREEDACEAVNNRFANEAGWNSWYAYGTSTTSSNLQNTIVWRQQNDVWATDFWVGDFYPSMVTGLSLQWGWKYVWNEEQQQYVWEYVYDWFEDDSLKTLHYNFYGEGGGSNNIHDDSIFYWTDYPYSKQHFTFIWTCACGNAVLDPHNQNQYVYGYYDDINWTGFVGMPLGWTSRDDLSLDGYHDPDESSYCYLGWNSTSKGMSANTGTPNYDYYWFVYFFYYYLVGDSVHHSVYSSLDWASQQIWGLDWDEQYNPLGWGHYYDGEWHWINVYGNSGLVLP